jgi:hypothetical protein
VKCKDTYKLLQLDKYEQQLAASKDRADHVAIRIRHAIKQAGVDPDQDDWWIDKEHWASAGDGIDICRKPVVRYSPRNSISSSNESLPALSSEQTFHVEGRGDVKLVKVTEALEEKMDSRHTPRSLIGAKVLIDGADKVISDVEFLRAPPVVKGDLIGLIVNEPTSNK